MARTQRRAVREGGKPTTQRRRGVPPGDPQQDEQDLHAQLRTMGLYASDTRGDGNCLFRALSDQLYGDPKYHAQLRQRTCDHLEAHPDMYAGFVETGRPFDAYVREMRELGTYGGHLELSAFAHCLQKPIRIVQPGYVYIVACDDGSLKARASRERRERERKRALASTDAHASTARRGRRGALSEKATEITVPECVGPLHIAYHSWEHYSSLRNVKGPHSGPPCIVSEDMNDDTHQDTEASASPAIKEAEKWIEMSVPGHYSRQCIRRLLRKYGEWEAVVEELLRREAEGGTSSDDQTRLSSSSSTASERTSESGSPEPALTPRAQRAARRSKRHASEAPTTRAKQVARSDATSSRSSSPHIPEIRELMI